MPCVIIVGGEALIDLIMRPDGGMTAIPGGGPYNTARTIARLGPAVAFAGGLSTDRFGQLLHDRLVADGVDDRFAVRTPRPTTLAIAELDATGTAAYRFYTEETSATAFDAEALPTFTDPTAPIVTAIHVGTLGIVLEPLASAMEALVARAPDDAVVMLDANCRPSATGDRDAYAARVDRLLRRADIVKVSGDDLAFLRPAMTPSVAVLDLLDAGPGVVLWTDGGGPVRIVTVRGQTMVVPPKVDVVDTVGAGDAFGGGFLAAWIGSGRGRAEIVSDDALLAATRHAVHVAAYTCTRAGAEPPTAAELAAWDILA
jgi:fructokinase